jgi:hypothetical protein
MPTTMVPLSAFSPLRRRRESTGAGKGSVRRRMALWLGGLAVALLLYAGVPAFWNWKHPISSSGGRYFVHRVAIALPVFTQGDPRWDFDLLGPTADTMGQAGCAVTSAAMVLSGYGVDTDPQRLNQYLTTHGGYTERGYIYWEKAADLSQGRIEKAYEDLPNYALIDQNLLAGNPVIVRLTLRNGHPHFVVIVGKEGWDYLIQDPARVPTWGIYPLKEITDRIEGLRFYRMLPMSEWPVPPVPVSPPTPTVLTPDTPTGSISAPQPIPATSVQVK